MDSYKSKFQEDLNELLNLKTKIDNMESEIQDFQLDSDDLDNEKPAGRKSLNQAKYIIQKYKPFFEAVVSNPWDAQYLEVMKEFIALKDPGTKVSSSVSSAQNSKGIDRKGIHWTISFHKPDSKWGNAWNFIDLIATRLADRKMSKWDAPELEVFEKTSMSKLDSSHPVMAAFMKTKGMVYPKDNPDFQKWQKENLEAFKAAIAYIKNWDPKKSKIFGDK
jgi:hypothetical protein